MAAAEFSVKVSGAAVAAAAEYSALKWPPSLGCRFSSGTKWRPRAEPGGATLFSVSSTFWASGNSPLLFFPLASGVEGNRQLWRTRPSSCCQWPSFAELRSGWAEAGVCSHGKRAWRGRTRRGGEGRGPAGGPGRWRGTSRGAGVPETGLPAGRKCADPWCRPGAARLFFGAGSEGHPRRAPP